MCQILISTALQWQWWWWCAVPKWSLQCTLGLNDCIFSRDGDDGDSDEDGGDDDDGDDDNYAIAISE